MTRARPMMGTRRLCGSDAWTRDEHGRWILKLANPDVTFTIFPLDHGYDLGISPAQSPPLFDRERASWPHSTLKRAIQEASKLVRKERYRRDPELQADVAAISQPIEPRPRALTLRAIETALVLAQTELKRLPDTTVGPERLAVWRNNVNVMLDEVQVARAIIERAK